MQQFDQPAAARKSKDDPWALIALLCRTGRSSRTISSSCIFRPQYGISCSEASLVACVSSAMSRLCRLGTRGFAPERLPERCSAARAEAGERLRVAVRLANAMATHGLALPRTIAPPEGISWVSPRLCSVAPAALSLHPHKWPELPLHESSCSVAPPFWALSHEFRAHKPDPDHLSDASHEFRVHQPDLDHSPDASMELASTFQPRVQMAARR